MDAQLRKRRGKELKDLDKQVWRTIGNGYKESSKDNIKSQYDSYKRFCEYFYLSKFPADSWQLCRFAQYLSNLGRAPGTVANAVSTVRTLQALKGYPTPDLYDVAIKLELKGLKNTSGHIKRQAKCMTPQLLRSIHNKVNFKDETEMVCFVALLTGFFLLLRKSNMVPISMSGKTGFDPQKQFRRCDFKLGQKTVLVDVRWSKTIQKSGRILQLPLLPLVNKEICPIYWIKKMVNTIPAKSTDPFFLVPHKGKYVPLTYKKLGDQLKTLAQEVKGTQEGWTLHCLRRGGATWCFNIDIGSEAIRLMGRLGQ